MRIDELVKGQLYQEPLEDSHTDGTLEYDGETVFTFGGKLMYGFNAPGWGYRWLYREEVLKLVKKENK